MHLRQLPTHVEVWTPAKINLFLEVLRRRADGFHEIETVIAAVTLRDTLRCVPLKEPVLRLTCRWAATPATACEPIPPGADNLVWKAIDLLRDRSKHSGGAAVELIKRIPAAAGLGGASSDAAAALMAANVAWQLGLSRKRLAELAAELGSDVPFFLSSGLAICRGRGEQIESQRSLPMHVVLVRPPVGLSTPEVYRACHPTAVPRGAKELLDALSQGNVAAAARNMRNDLEPAAREQTPWIGRLVEAFSATDVLGHQMSGSGSSYFGICRSARHARRVAGILRGLRLGAVFAVTTASAT